MAKIPYQDPLSNEVQSPLLAGTIEGLSKVSETVGMDTEVITDSPLAPIPGLDESDPYRIYQCLDGNRIWLSSPAPVIKLNGNIMSVSQYHYSINYIGGSITFIGDYRPSSSDSLTVSCTHVIKGSAFADKILADVDAKNQALEESVDQKTSELEESVNQNISSVNQNIATVNQNISNLDSRVSGIIADGQQTEGNTELIDIRNGYDGNQYGTAGDAVRKQFERVYNNVHELQDEVLKKKEIDTEKHENVWIYDSMIQTQQDYIVVSFGVEKGKKYTITRSENGVIGVGFNNSGFNLNYIIADYNRHDGIEYTFIVGDYSWCHVFLGKTLSAFKAEMVESNIKDYLEVKINDLDNKTQSIESDIKDLQVPVNVSVYEDYWIYNNTVSRQDGYCVVGFEIEKWKKYKLYKEGSSNTIGVGFSNEILSETNSEISIFNYDRHDGEKYSFQNNEYKYCYVFIGLKSTNSLSVYFSNSESYNLLLRETPYKLKGELGIDSLSNLLIGKNLEDNLYTTRGTITKKGNKIVDKNGDEIVLTGIGTHTLNLYNSLYTKECMKTLTLYGINCIRATVYLTTNISNYTNGKICLGWIEHSEELKPIIENLVDLATSAGLYVIIDWHTLHTWDGGDVTKYQTQQENFFSYFSNLYKNHGNVLYEIHNEPYQNTNEQLLPSVLSCASIIRENNPNAILLCGIGTDSVDWVIGANKLYNIDNNLDIFICPHLYTGEQTVETMIKKYVEQGIPIFVSEWGNSSLSGTDTPNDSEAIKMFDFCHSNNISYCVWKMTYQDMDTSILVYDEEKINYGYKYGGWIRSDLSHNGKLYFGSIRKYRFGIGIY